MYSFIYISLKLKSSSDDHLKQQKWILKLVILINFALFILSQTNCAILDKDLQEDKLLLIKQFEQHIGIH